MTRSFASWRLVLASFLVLTAGCPDGGSGERPDAPRGLDAAVDETVDAFSRDDAFGGPDVRSTTMCGDVGEECCGDPGTCSAGRRCETDTCCAVPGAGVACEDPEDCCGGADCVGGTCCSLQGTACRTSAECCSDLLCESGTCTLPVEDCGRDGGECCPGDECRAGSVCAGGRCETCGGDGEICCAAPLCHRKSSPGLDGLACPKATVPPCAGLYSKVTLFPP
ncbi:MAG: hypothetical protein J0L92_39430, partial [Deltaproteobacteria bacterium]|nr:hypothetical protein [Deltaproteobacteria bacterium]